MNPALAVVGVIALAMLALALYLLWRPNPLQRRMEQLLEERSRLAVSLEHSQQQLQAEGSTALGGSMQDAARYLLKEQTDWAALIRDARIRLE